MPGKTINRKLAARVCAALSAVLLASSLGVGSTTAYLMAQTPTFVNTFLPGKGAALTIEKTVEHPFGDDYQLPDGLAFDFTIDLGEDNANAQLAVETDGSTTDVSADASGVATVAVPANGSAEIYGIPEGASVTVAEAPRTGFAEANGQATQTVAEFGTEGATLAFTNNYSPAPTDLSALTVEAGKTLSGRDWKDSESFTFVLERMVSGSVADGADGEDDASSATGEGDAAGGTSGAATDATDNAAEPTWVEVDRQTLTFDASDPSSTTVAFDASKLSAIDAAGAGEYQFRVREIAGGEDGMSYDSTHKAFTVLVGDADMDGSLEVQGLEDCAGVTWTEGSGVDAGKHTVHAAFANVYRGTTASITAAKTVVDAAGSWRGGLSGFEISVTEADAAYAKLEGGTSLTMTTDAGGNAALTVPLYEAGTRYYVIEEQADDPVAGMSYDVTRYGAEVSVAEGSDGRLVAAVSYVKLPGADAADGAQPEVVSAVAFVNRYAPDAATVTITGTKQLVKQVAEGEPSDGAASGAEGDAAAGGDTANGAQAPTGSGSVGVTTENVALSGGEFFFELHVGANAAGTPLLAVPNAADGTFSFEALSFSEVGTYRYTVVEQLPAETAGITYDRSLYAITVAVTDEGTGQLSASMTIEKGGQPVEAITFINMTKVSDPDIPGGDDPDGPGNDDGDDDGSDPDLPGSGSDDGDVVPGGSSDGTDLEQTGDETKRALALSGVLAIASAVLGVVAFINLRRSRDAE